MNRYEVDICRYGVGMSGSRLVWATVRPIWVGMSSCRLVWANIRPIWVSMSGNRSVWAIIKSVWTGMGQYDVGISGSRLV